MQFENVTFAFFNETDCGRRSVAVSLNPSQVTSFYPQSLVIPTPKSSIQSEYTPPMLFRGITWFNTSANAKFNFGKIPQTTSLCDNGCDAINRFFASDLDGSLAGIPKGTTEN